ncbi:MAG: iron-sulfur cluster assembly accessory protein [Candidatus Margulisiibacteriota bacterium]
MTDCGNVKKVFVPNDKPIQTADPTLTFGATDGAVEKVRHFISKDGKNHKEYGLRVQVVKDGCSGNSYDISLAKIDESKSNGDKIFNFDDVTVIVEKLSYMFVIGSQLDYVETLLMSGFQINNPNVKRSCSCGSSFSIK